MDPNEILDLDTDSIILFTTDSPHEVEVDSNLDSTLSTAFAATGGLLIGYDFGCINGLVRSQFFIDAIEVHGKANVSQNNIAAMMSLLFCGGFVGAVCGGLLGDQIGRKWLIQLGYVVYALGVSWQIALNPQKTAFVIILIGRFIIGVGIGLNSVGTVLYVTETVSL
jgi:MFS family permease